MHWVQQLDELEQVVKNFADAMRLHPRQDEGILGDMAQTLRDSTPGDYLRDLPRLDTVDDPELYRTSSALARAIRVVTGSRGRRWSAREVVPALDAIRAGIAPMRAALTASAAKPATVESVVAELRGEFTLSLAVMLSGQYAVVTKLYEWYSSASGVPEDAYLDVSRFAIIEKPAQAVSPCVTSKSPRTAVSPCSRRRPGL